MCRQGMSRSTREMPATARKLGNGISNMGFIMPNSNALTIEYRKLNHLSPDSGYARRRSKAKDAKIDRLIEKFGYRTPLVVRPDGQIIDGHARYFAAQRLGFEEVPVLVVTGLSAGEIEALSLALNRIPADAVWDDDALVAKLNVIIAEGVDLDLTGFDAPEIDMALDLEPSPKDATEEIETAEVEPSGPRVTALGDVWQLRRHHIVCGDMLENATWAMLPNDRLAASVFSDPPYNVPIAGFVSGLGSHVHEEFAMAAGEMSRPAFLAFLTAFLTQSKSRCTPGAVLFVFIDWRSSDLMVQAARDAGLAHLNLCVWTKTNGGMGSLYRSQHELVHVFRNGSAPHPNNVELGKHGRNRTNVWRYAGVNTFGPERTNLREHPTVKPVAMIVDALRDVTKRGDLVLDPFLGSGSTLLAAEQSGRTCHGIELAPGYVDVAIRRWQAQTGRDAVHMETGETFAEREANVRKSKDDASSVDAEVSA